MHRPPPCPVRRDPAAQPTCRSVCTAAVVVRRARPAPGAWALLCVAALGLSGGCWSRTEGTEERGAAETAMNVSLTFTRIAEGPVVRFEGQAYFARASASDAERVPTILGVPDDDAIPLGTCRRVDSAEELDRAIGPLSIVGPVDVTLLDAGKIEASGPADTVALARRHYPEVTPYVNGVVYGTQSWPPLTLEPGTLYEVTGRGGEGIGPFVARALAPRAFPSLEVPVHHRGDDLELRWALAGDAAEPIVLTVGWSTGDGSYEVRCRVRDDGHFPVRRELLAGLPGPPALTAAEVTATRFGRGAVTPPGATRGTFLLGLRVAQPLPVSGDAPSRR